MIFSPDLAAKVLNGEKTQTRRRIKDGTCRYMVGRTYAVQDKRGGKALGRIRILSVTRVAVASITREDAQAEGFKDASEFRMRWVQMYGAEGYDNYVWRIEFELVSE